MRKPGRPKGKRPYYQPMRRLIEAGWDQDKAREEAVRITARRLARKKYRTDRAHREKKRQDMRERYRREKQNESSKQDVRNVHLPTRLSA